MYNRQATRLILLLVLLPGLWACSPSEPPIATPSLVPPTATPIASPLGTRVPPTLTILPSATATPLTCLSQPGDLQNGEVATEGRPTAFIIYLPPCYDHFTDQHYPVLYLLNGQTYTDDQWVRLGAPSAADELIHSGQSVPFIMVFPEDRYWNIQQGTCFGQYMLNDIIPYIDGHYRTVADRQHRAIGGLSRGGGWAFQLGMTRPELFSSLGLHSPAIFGDDRAKLDRWVRDMPSELWPRLYLDVGDNDPERNFNIHLEEVWTRYEIPHEWHLNTGAHDEAYWSKHVDEYIQWYAQGWAQP
jgi:enterochelin esterase-like enzyme